VRDEVILFLTLASSIWRKGIISFQLEGEREREITSKNKLTMYDVASVA
jgi:hypothetical protein